MKKVCMLLLVLVLSGGMSNCTKFQTVHQCKKDCDSSFLGNIIAESVVSNSLILSIYERQLCYNNCEGK
jgi:hypothetical protein